LRENQSHAKAQRKYRAGLTTHAWQKFSRPDSRREAKVGCIICLLSTEPDGGLHGMTGKDSLLLQKIPLREGLLALLLRLA
jgi:hypothetical protein